MSHSEHIFLFHIFYQVINVLLDQLPICWITIDVLSLIVVKWETPVIVKLTPYIIKFIDKETKLYFRHMDLRNR